MNKFYNSFLLAALLFLLFCYWSIFTAWENAINRPIQLLSSLWYIKGNSVVVGLLQWILGVICCLIDLPENRKPHSQRVFSLFTFPLWQCCCWSWQQVHIAGLLSGDMDSLGESGEEMGFERTRRKCAVYLTQEWEQGQVENAEIVQWQSTLNNLLQAAKLLEFVIRFWKNANDQQEINSFAIFKDNLNKLWFSLKVMNYD